MKRGVLRWILRMLTAAAGGVAIFALLAWIAPEWTLLPMGAFLDVSESPRKADYILVLNGDPETRPFAAAALVKTGWAREVLLTRQKSSMESATVQEGAMLSELEITRKILLKRGVPEQAIRVLPGEITCTADEARELGLFLEANPQSNVLVVTNTFHTRRARMVFHRLLGDNASRMSIIGVPRDWVDDKAWWQTSHGCAVYVGEYCKLPYYWLRY